MSAICLVHGNQISEFQETTEIIFNELKTNEIQYYIDEMKPFDKAGSYGIQEWIGLIAVKEIKGSYTNVIGLPTQRLHKRALQKLNWLSNLILNLPLRLFANFLLKGSSSSTLGAISSADFCISIET